MQGEGTENSYCLASNLRALRRQMKWSQEDLAERIGLNRGNIASYENGSAEPKICNLVKLARIFDVSVIDLTLTDLREGQPVVGSTWNDPGKLPLAMFSGLVAQLEKEADDLQQAIKGLHCYFKIKLKNAGGVPGDVQFVTEHFEQLHDMAQHLLQAHQQLLTNIRQQLPADCRPTSGQDQMQTG
jgi:transcriptional regulator with XRE-family HTH domain